MTSTDDTRKRLLEAAGEIFAAKGFQAATVREICQRAGANVAAINYHFGDKERLYIEAVKLAHHCRAETDPLPAWPAGTPAAIRLRDFIHGMLRRMSHADDPGWYLTLLMRELAQPTAAVGELVRDFIRPHFDVLLAILRDVLPKNAKETQVRVVGLSIVGQCFAYKTGRPICELLLGVEAARQRTLEQLAEDITRFSLAALGLGKPLGRPDA